MNHTHDIPSLVAWIRTSPQCEALLNWEKPGEPERVHASVCRLNDEVPPQRETRPSEPLWFEQALKGPEGTDTATLWDLTETVIKAKHSERTIVRSQCFDAFLSDCALWVMEADDSKLEKLVNWLELATSGEDKVPLFAPFRSLARRWNTWRGTDAGQDLDWLKWDDRPSQDLIEDESIWNMIPSRHDHADFWDWLTEEEDITRKVTVLCWLGDYDRHSRQARLIESFVRCPANATNEVRADFAGMPRTSFNDLLEDVRVRLSIGALLAC